ncbi:MAG: ATP-binding protein [Spirochaetia bacterium]|nr:ATP-binding protein [Spirochaetia bacterium]
MKIKISPAIKNLNEVKSFIEENFKSWGTPYMDMMDIILAVDESITNIITHGYDEPSDKESIELFIEQKGNIVTIKITDNGKKYDFHATPAPDIRKNLSGDKRGGFGVHLVKSVMNHVEHTWNNGKNTLIFTKIITPVT